MTGFKRYATKSGNDRFWRGSRGCLLAIGVTVSQWVAKSQSCVLTSVQATACIAGAMVMSLLLRWVVVISPLSNETLQRPKQWSKS